MERSRVVLPVFLSALVVLATGCFTGQRAISVPDTTPTAPSTSSAGTGASAASPLEAIATILGRPATSAETAVYDVRPTFQGTPTSVTVSRDATRTLVSVRNIEFRTTASGSRTCRRDTHTCTPGLDAQPLSDLLISATFWGPAARQALRSPGMVARAASAKTSTVDVPGAGRSAQCVTVPGPTIDERFCVLASGLLAIENTARVDITLSSYSPSFQQGLWDEFPAS